jgi:GNAT superfamily N-acetyltransferase
MAFDVRAATDRDTEAVAQLIREMIPGVTADARLEWMYYKNPAGRALTWIASEHGEIAGCTSYFPWRLQLDGQRVLGALGGDGYVRPKFRRRGLGALLHDAARVGMQAAGIQCMYGAPGAMNLTPLKHAGSREVGHVARWARPLRGAALGVKGPFDAAIGNLLRPRFVARLDPMTPGDQRVDDVWHAFAPTVKLAAIRDSTFYTWRFLSGPAQKEPPFVIVAKDRPIGACSLELMGEGRSVRIVDLMTIPGAWHRCLSAIAAHVADTTAAHFIDIKLMALDGRRRHMWRAGFTERDSKPFLVVIPKHGDRRFLDPMRWFYCGGDADLDSLE